MSPRPADATDDRPPERKSVLFCPDCERARPVDGDWTVRERAGRVELRCPDCDVVLTDRGRGGRAPAPPARLWTAWIRAATAWVRLVRLTSAPRAVRGATPRWRR